MKDFSKIFHANKNVLIGKSNIKNDLMSLKNSSAIKFQIVSLTQISHFTQCAMHPLLELEEHSNQQFHHETNQLNLTSSKLRLFTQAEL